jgi:hypothetical protein
MCVARRGVGRGKWEKRFRLGESRGQIHVGAYWNTARASFFADVFIFSAH